MDLYSPTNFHVLRCIQNTSVQTYRQACGEYLLTLSADAPLYEKIATLVFAAYSQDVTFGHEVFPLQRIEVRVVPGQKDVTADLLIAVPDLLTLEVFGLTKEGRLFTDEHGQTVGFAEEIQFDVERGEIQ